MKKMTAIIAGMLLVLPAAAFAATGIVGDCVDCHTMHNSEMGQPVALVGTSTTPSATPIQNLLRMDCIACHASPDATSAVMPLSGGSQVPQVSWTNASTDITTNLAGGNFYYNALGQRKGHNVIDLTAADASNAGNPADVATYGAPPGNGSVASHHGEEEGVFTTTGGTAFDAFTCAGARGCHGTRSQALAGSTADWDGNASTPNTWEGTRRTGIAAISGAHHNSYDGAKTSTGYSGEAVHDGQVVADGYRFIPGLMGYGNEVDRWQNKDATSHNEYYANSNVFSLSCANCHQEGTAGVPGVVSGGLSSRAALTSYLKVPGNDISGFCATCHGMFHSSGTENGTSGAFLRHPSDWVIPDSGEYSAYTTFDVTAPVARPTVYTAADATVTPGTDLVMCLSCHEAHATPNDYMLRFDYSAMTAGGYGTIATATAEGGCLACHTTKGVLPENR